MSELRETEAGKGVKEGNPVGRGYPARRMVGTRRCGRTVDRTNMNTSSIENQMENTIFETIISYCGREREEKGPHLGEKKEL